MRQILQEASPTGFLEIFQSIHKGMTNAASIIFYIFIVGGAFGVLQSTEFLLIPIPMTFFALSGAML